MNITCLLVLSRQLHYACERFHVTIFSAECQANARTKKIPRENVIPKSRSREHAAFARVYHLIKHIKITTLRGLAPSQSAMYPVILSCSKYTRPRLLLQYASALLRAHRARFDSDNLPSSRERTDFNIVIARVSVDGNGRTANEIVCNENLVKFTMTDGLRARASARSRYIRAFNRSRSGAVSADAATARRRRSPWLLLYYFNDVQLVPSRNIDLKPDVTGCGRAGVYR